MHLRPFTTSDTPYLVSLSSAAFISDPVYAFLFPGRHSHPYSYRFYRLTRLRKMLLNPAMTIMVCVSDDADGELHDPAFEPPQVAVASVDAKSEGDGQAEVGNSQTATSTSAAESHNGHERILGYAIWRNLPPSPSLPSTPSPSPFTRLETLLRTLESHYHSLLPLPCSSPQNFSTFNSHLTSDPNPLHSLPTSQIHLAELVTAPCAQRRGIGTFLVKWGLERAEKAEVPVSLVASTVGEGLYRRLGFLVLDWPEFAVGEGGGKMVWEGREMGRWVERGREVIVRGKRERVVEGRVRVVEVGMEKVET